jgi:hypothetical protein
MEEVLTVDEETGEKRIVEQPKLLIPDLKIRQANMRDEQQYHQLIEALVGAGVPISMKTRLTNVPIKIDEEYESSAEEMVEKGVAEQKGRKDLYLKLKDEGLPIPEDLKKDFEPTALQETDAGVKPQAGTEETKPPDETLVPTPGSPLVPAPPMGEEEPGQPGQEGGRVLPLPVNRQMQRPPESDEQRADMPKPASLKKEDLERFAVEHPDDPGLLGRGPRHVGMRRMAKIDKNVPLEDQVEDVDLADTPGITRTNGNGD